MALLERQRAAASAAHPPTGAPARRDSLWTGEIKQLEEGVEEYQNQIDLCEKEKMFLRKGQVEDREWCATFDRVIGPFEAKYDECQTEVRCCCHPIATE